MGGKRMLGSLETKMKGSVVRWVGGGVCKK